MTTTINDDALSALTSVFEAVWAAADKSKQFDDCGFYDVSRGDMSICLLTREELRALSVHFLNRHPKITNEINDLLARDRQHVTQLLLDLMQTIVNAYLKGRLPEGTLEVHEWEGEKFSIDLYTYDSATNTTAARCSSFEDAEIIWANMFSPGIDIKAGTVYAVVYDMADGYERDTERVTLKVQQDGDTYDIDNDQLLTEVLADICEYLSNWN